MNKSKLVTGLIMAITTLSVVTITNQSLVTAQENQEASPSAATTEKLKERIEKIVEEKRDQIKGVLSAIDQQKRGTIGNVTRVSEESVTIKTRVATEIIPLNEGVEIQKSGDEIAIDEIAVGDWLVVMGLIQDDTFETKRVLVSSESLRPDMPVVALGSIESIERSGMTILPRNDAASFAISTSTTTEYQDLNGEEIARTDIEEETQALVVGYEDEDGERSAELIRILTVISEDEG